MWKCTMKSKSRIYIQPNSVRGRFSADNFLYLFLHSTRFEPTPLLPRSNDSLCVMTNYLTTYRGSKSTVKNRYINRGDTYFVTFNEINCGDYTCVLDMWRLDILMYFYEFNSNLTQHLKSYAAQNNFSYDTVTGNKNYTTASIV
jgi:hypothetical protein